MNKYQNGFPFTKTLCITISAAVCLQLCFDIVIHDSISKFFSSTLFFWECQWVVLSILSLFRLKHLDMLYMVLFKTMAPIKISKHPNCIDEQRIILRNWDPRNDTLYESSYTTKSRNVISGKKIQIPTKALCFRLSRYFTKWYRIIIQKNFPEWLSGGFGCVWGVWDSDTKSIPTPKMYS